jgi:hypothetical protein
VKFCGETEDFRAPWSVERQDFPLNGPPFFSFFRTFTQGSSGYSSAQTHNMSSFKKRKHESDDLKRHIKKSKKLVEAADSDEPKKLPKKFIKIRREPQVEHGNSSGAESIALKSASESTKTFGELGVMDSLCEACEKLGYTKPTPIQEQSIPVALQGKGRCICYNFGKHSI